MQSFDRDIQSFIFLGNKAIDQNEFDNCKEYEHLKLLQKPFLIQLVTGDIACQKPQ